MPLAKEETFRGYDENCTKTEKRDKESDKGKNIKGLESQEEAQKEADDERRSDTYRAVGVL